MNMIREIRSINNIPAFADLSWSGAQAEKYNLIYGWNASGKTTLSRVLRFLELGEIDLESFTDVTFRMATDDGLVNEGDLESNNLSVRVYNEDFIDENLSFRESSAEPIVILGKDNIEVEEKIKGLEEKENEKKQQVEELEGRLDEIPDLGEILTKCGRAVVEEFRDAPLAPGRYDGRRYNRRNVVQLIEEKGVDGANVAQYIIDDNKKLETYREQLSREWSRLEFEGLGLDQLEELFEEANTLLQAEVETIVIERLEEDDEIRQWVEEGVRIHRDRDESSCQFCGNSIPVSRMEQYREYFTSEVEKMNRRLGSVFENIEEARDLLEIQFPDSQRLFPDLRDRYSEARRGCEVNAQKVVSALERLLQRVDARKGRVQVADSRQETVPYPVEAVEALHGNFRELKRVDEKQRSRIERREQEVEESARKLEIHVVSLILSNRDYFSHKGRRRELKDVLEDASEDLDRIRSDIQEAHAGLRDTAIAVEEINRVVGEFLGEGEIELVVADESAAEGEDNGEYRVTSRGQETEHLSDGEKSVLALAYFLVSLREEGTSLQESIVVVDDPVDSQDEVFLYRTFGLLKEYFRDAGQVFIFTHNYQFFNVMRGWLTSKRFADEAELFRIAMRRGDERVVMVSDLPKLLEEYNTEYQYLFSRVYEFSTNPEIGEGPVIANVARKVLEHFAAFKWSCNQSEEFTSIVKNRFIRCQNRQKQAVGNAVVRFVHEYSHGEEFDRSVTSSVLEAREICENVMKFIRLSDEVHYDALVNESEVG